MTYSISLSSCICNNTKREVIQFIVAMCRSASTIRIPAVADNYRKRYYHIQLLCDAEYMVQINENTYRLTSQGHDFIEAIRDNGIWDKIKDAVANTGGNATIEMVKTLAVGFLKKTISEHTGSEL